MKRLIYVNTNSNSAKKLDDNFKYISSMNMCILVFVHKTPDCHSGRVSMTAMVTLTTDPRSREVINMKACIKSAFPLVKLNASSGIKEIGEFADFPNFDFCGDLTL